jgi:hypothetical protein
MSGSADPETESDQPARPARRSHRLLKVAALGGAVVLLLNEDLRNHLLDALFGAEEEFDYSSVTEPPGEETPPDEASEPWVRAADFEAPTAPASESAVDATENATADGDAADDAPWTEGVGRPVSISPSPAAWRAAAEESEGSPPEVESEAAEPPPEASEAEAEMDDAAYATPQYEPETTEPEPAPHGFEPSATESAPASFEPYAPTDSEPETAPQGFEPYAPTEPATEPAAQDFDPYAATESEPQTFEPEATAPEPEGEQPADDAAEPPSPSPYRPNPRQDRPGRPPDAPHGWWSPRTADGDQHDS